MAGEWRQVYNKQTENSVHSINIGDTGFKVYVDRRKERRTRTEGKESDIRRKASN